MGPKEFQRSHPHPAIVDRPGVSQIRMRARPAWGPATAAGLAVALLAGCSAGAAQRHTAGPSGGAADGLSPGQATSSSSPSGANSRPTPGGRSQPATTGKHRGKAATATKPGSTALHPAPLGPRKLEVQAARSVVTQLPKPVAPNGASITFSPAIFMGPSMYGDLGSSAWNITHRDAD